jgi:2-C-methyl-D-erythritol 4-phosphate cytidylyltransferase
MTDLLAAAAPTPLESARFWALIPCAGTGSRAIAPGAPAPDLPKQYHAVAGAPMVVHTLAAFAGVARIHHTLVVVAAGDGFWRSAALGLPPMPFSTEDCGGATRAESVTNGLQALLARGASAHDWVLVHDAARCLVTPAQIDALIDACEHDAVGGLLAHKLADTLKTAVTGPGGVRVASTVDRADKWLAQTPQMFRIAPLLDALEHAGSAVTDEASAMEAAGHRPRLVPGGAQNFKVTYPDDFALAAAVLSQRERGATLERYRGQRDQRQAPGNPFF